MKVEWNLRSIYFYLISFMTLVMIIMGTVQLVQGAAELAYPPPVFYDPGPAEIKARAESQKVSESLVREQVALEKQRQEQQIKYDRIQRLARPLALLIVALPIYRYHWRRIQSDNR